MNRGSSRRDTSDDADRKSRIRRIRADDIGLQDFARQHQLGILDPGSTEILAKPEKLVVFFSTNHPSRGKSIWTAKIYDPLGDQDVNWAHLDACSRYQMKANDFGLYVPRPVENPKNGTYINRIAVDGTARRATVASYIPGRGVGYQHMKSARIAYAVGGAIAEWHRFASSLAPTMSSAARLAHQPTAQQQDALKSGPLLSSACELDQSVLEAIMEVDQAVGTIEQFPIDGDTYDNTILHGRKVGFIDWTYVEPTFLPLHIIDYVSNALDTSDSANRSMIANVLSGYASEGGNLETLRDGLLVHQMMTHVSDWNAVRGKPRHTITPGYVEGVQEWVRHPSQITDPGLKAIDEVAQSLLTNRIAAKSQDLFER